MEIQADTTRDADLERLPSLRIDSLVAEVPLDDRINADAAFDHSFVESLKQGMTWYLSRRGLRCVAEGGDLRLTGAIIAYEGNKGWGDWGVDLSLSIKVYRGSDLFLRDTLRANLRYGDDEEVEDEVRPRYKARGMSVSFPEVLFTRVGIDLSEKLIVLLKETAGGAIEGVHAVRARGSPEARGKVSVDASEAHAEVLVDGKLIGTTPVSELPLEAGVHTIEVRKKGFKSWVREVTIMADASTRFIVNLEAEPQE